MIAKITLIGMYNYDQDLFENLELPDELDPETAVNNILLQYGERGLIYPDVEFVKLMIGVWSKKWRSSFNRIVAALEADYNPVHNYDRYEDITETNDRSEKHSGKDSTTASGDRSEDYSEKSSASSSSTGEDERTVSAYNEDSYQPDSKNETSDTVASSGDRSTNSSVSSSDDSSTTYGHEITNDDSMTHSGHLYGNIGVTTSQQMIEAELELRRQNCYDIVAEMFAKEFCYYMY